MNALMDFRCDESSEEKFITTPTFSISKILPNGVTTYLGIYRYMLLKSPDP